MKLELLTVIAQLCLTPNGSIAPHNIYKEQLECQKLYISCVDYKVKKTTKRDVDYFINLKECVLEK